ncbi:hypothetical protein M407DRAFT_243219 [Tulasnella calospora MUT 4182]|uniref:Uncharacterized protein n=1 Tax=Tulasnella calospora MUT 4182 TaxID=1051891 RepID=A0A0C3M2N1_9AGAM|nr:hypothetical protein M407DRAFT_243219 [Tulasnella calospora MUT 4182]
MNCTILDNGEVVPVWKRDDASEIRLFVTTITNSYYIVPDAEAFIRPRNNHAKRGVVNLSCK